MATSASVVFLNSNSVNRSTNKVALDHHSRQQFKVLSEVERLPRRPAWLPVKRGRDIAPRHAERHGF
jgi:hypothetical protein